MMYRLNQVYCATGSCGEGRPLIFGNNKFTITPLDKPKSKCYNLITLNILNAMKELFFTPPSFQRAAGRCKAVRKGEKVSLPSRAAEKQRQFTVGRLSDR